MANQLGTRTGCVLFGGCLILTGCGSPEDPSFKEKSSSRNFSYHGNNSPARIDRSNANILFADLFLFPDTPIAASDNLGDAAVTRDARLLGGLFHEISANVFVTLRQTKPLSASGQAASSITAATAEIYSCESGGSVTVTDKLRNDGTGEIIFYYKNCKYAGTISNGRVTVNALVYDMTRDEIMEGDMVYDKFTFNDGYVTWRFDGSIYRNAFVGQRSEQLIVDMVFGHSVLAQTFRWQNVELTTLFDEAYFASGYSTWITGTVSDPDFGTFEIYTEQPLTYANMTDVYPQIGGLIRIEGKDTSNAQLSIPYAFKARIDIDSDGNGESEDTLIYPLTDLRGAAETN